MRIGVAAAWLSLSLALLAGCGSSGEPPQNIPTRTDSAGLLTLTPTAAAPSPTPTAPTPRPPTLPQEESGGGTGGQIAFVEQLPTLADRGTPAPRPNLELRPDAWREVAVIQMALNSVSTSRLDVDGHFGPSTDAAVRAFQSARGIEIDGYVGPETLRELVDALSEAGGAIPPPTVTSIPPAIQPFYGFSGGTVCSDGWISTSSGSGTCSWHGGVK